jgi:hypothetical protein
VEPSVTNRNRRIFSRTDEDMWDQFFTTFKVIEAEVIALGREPELRP